MARRTAMWLKSTVIGRLRKALSRARERDPIRAARSAGYAFDEAFGKSLADGVYRLVRR
jgi:hypothetical protein